MRFNRLPQFERKAGIAPRPFRRARKAKYYLVNGKVPPEKKPSLGAPRAQHKASQNRTEILKKSKIKVNCQKLSKIENSKILKKTGKSPNRQFIKNFPGVL